MTLRRFDAMIAEFVKTKRPIRAEVVILSPEEVSDWVRIRVNPQRFVPRVFEGDWALRKFHPDPGEIRLLRVLTGADGVTRVIGRQGHLFAYPWA